MGSYLSRNLRDAFEAAGCDGIAPLDSENDVRNAFSSDKGSITQQTNPRPVTPIPHHRTRLLSLDPRSPSAGIVRTPIEVTATPNSINSKAVRKVECDANGTERNYLETDLDSIDDISANPCTPVTSVGHKLPPGLSASHLLKLKFLELDPRSPSEGIVRTPIQVVASHEKQSSGGSSKENIDTSNLSSSRSLFGSSEESVNISKACSEPSAIVSDYEQNKDWSLSLDLNDLEQEEANFNSVDEPGAQADIDQKSDILEEHSDQSCESGSSISSEKNYEIQMKRDEELAKEIALLAEKISQTPISSRVPTGVHIFSEGSTRTPQNTPRKKSTRTPLTPICNLTPNDVVNRGKKKQEKCLNKEKLVCKILSGCENTPSKQKSVLMKKGKKPTVDENARLDEWDQDGTIII